MQFGSESKTSFQIDVPSPLLGERARVRDYFRGMVQFSEHPANLNGIIVPASPDPDYTISTMPHPSGPSPWGEGRVRDKSRAEAEPLGQPSSLLGSTVPTYATQGATR